FAYVNTFPWDTSDCTTAATNATENCCSALRSLFGIGLSNHLHKNKTFYFPTLQSSISCLNDFQSHLSSLNIKQTFSTCLTSPDEFVANPSSCAGIMTVSDWIKTVGPSPVFESSCDGDLGMAVNARLVSLNQNSTKCFQFTAIYAAGIINSFGPEDVETADCILAVSISKPGALVGTIVVLGGILIYRRCSFKRKESQLHKDYVKNVKDRVLPNTGAKWFRIDELDEATKGFSQQNLIGQGGFGVVYKGTLSDGTVVAVKKMTSLDTEADNDFVNEAEIISKIRHRNLLPLRGFWATSDSVNGTERIAGTYGYVAPEYALYGQLTEKSDVYSFGI
ncbi:hypothetical protein M8C21_031607, partial [Ambrosia artemisiifolia]